ncbi:hypothetical protein Tco_1115555 [Tanacetum coccineum]
MPLTDINKAITEAEVIWVDQYCEVACKERLLQRIEPWIHRELNAILGDPNPAVLVHLVTPLFISSLAEGTSGPGGDKIKYLERLHRLLSLELILPVVTATVERGYWRMEFVEKELKNNKADQLFIDGSVTHIGRDVFFKVSNDDIKSNFQAMKTRKE